MNMSDDVTGVTLQIVQKGADVAAHAAKEVFDAIMRLLMELGRNRERNRNNQANPTAKPEKPEVTSTDLTDIKTGRVEMKTLRDNAKAIGDTLSMSENALTKEDMKFIVKKAKAYGIPVAFSNERSKDNIFASVRTGDLPLFKQICTELMKSKIAERPQELGNFHCEAWEIPFLTAHLNKNDLSAQFIHTADGKNLCVFEKKDEKAIRMTRDAFVRQCNEVKSEMAFDRDESGFITIKNLRSGKELSFDEIPDKKSLASKMQEAFGYDEIKAQIAAARFGEEMLTGEQKEKFFSDSAQQEFKQVEANVSLEGEDTVCKEYQCWRVIPKTDERPRIVFQNDEGEFSVLEPEKMTRHQMRNALSEQLGITDRKRQTALIQKAERIASFYAQSESHTAEYEFKKSDFDLTDVRYAMGLRKTDEQGNTIYTKKLPVSSMSSEINRTEKDFFRVSSTVTAIETDANGVDHERHDTQELVLSFSDKKSSLQQLREMYVAQSVPDHVAKQMAKEVFRKAEMQNPEKPIRIQEVRDKAMTVAYGTQTAEVTTSDKQAAASKIAEDFGVPEETAEVIVEKAEEIKQDTARDRVEAAQQTQTDINSAVKQMDERKQEFIIVCRADEPKRTMYIYNGDDGNHSAAIYNGTLKTGSLSETTDMSKVQEFADSHGVKGDVLVFESQEAYDEFLAADKEVHPDNYDILDLISDEEADLPITEETTAETLAETVGNGHEAHPEGNVLNEAAAGFGAAAASDAPMPEMPLPEIPPQSMGARR